MMHEVLSGLTQQPGVKLAAVISSDGVPVCVLERASRGSGEFVDCTNSSQPSLEGQRIDPASLVALAASWVDDVMRAGGQIAWELPRRFVLAASQGNLVVQRGPNAHVMVVLEPSVATDTMALPLEVAVEQLNKLLRDLGRFDPDQSAAALPSVGAASASGPAMASAPRHLHPSATTDAATRGGAAGTPPTAGPTNPSSSAPFDATGDH